MANHGVLLAILFASGPSLPCVVAHVLLEEAANSSIGSVDTELTRHSVVICAGVVGVGSARDLDAPMVTLQSSRPRARKLATATVWCVARGNLSDAALQGALDWVCGPMPDQGQVNCGPLQLGNACFTPDTVAAHSSWAFNSYFQSRNASDSACEFQGTGMQVTVDPSESSAAFTILQS